MVRSRETEMMGLWLKALVEICSYFDLKKKKKISANISFTKHQKNKV